MSPPREDATGGEHFAYFVVRIRVNSPDHAPGLAGVVERLETGRKCSFPDGQELIRLLADWSQVPGKMRGAGRRGNEAAAGETGDVDSGGLAARTSF